MSNYPSYTVCPIKPVLPHKICQKSKIYSQMESIKENTHELSDGEDSHECLWNGLCNYTLRFIQINFVLQNIRSMNKTSSTLSIYNILMLLLRIQLEIVTVLVMNMKFSHITIVCVTSFIQIVCGRKYILFGTIGGHSPWWRHLHYETNQTFLTTKSIEYSMKYLLCNSTNHTLV